MAYGRTKSRSLLGTLNDFSFVGFLDVGPEAAWHSAIICNPFGPLIEKGSFDLDIVLEIRPKDLFGHDIL
jgi:hypothetical protein